MAKSTKTKKVSKVTPKKSASRKKSVKKSELAYRQNMKNYAASKGVTQPFFSVKGVVHRTSDGKWYDALEPFFADGGLQDWSNVQNAD